MNKTEQEYMDGKGKKVFVKKIPDCALCRIRKAKYDGRTKMGSWAFMCQECFDAYGFALGTGCGQELIQRDEL